MEYLLQQGKFCMTQYSSLEIGTHSALVAPAHLQLHVKRVQGCDLSYCRGNKEYFQVAKTALPRADQPMYIAQQGPARAEGMAYTAPAQPQYVSQENDVIIAEQFPMPSKHNVHTGIHGPDRQPQKLQLSSIRPVPKTTRNQVTFDLPALGLQLTH